MAKIYKIHPSIGIARVGKSTSGYFLEADVLSGQPYEIDDSGKEAVFQGYKDAVFQVRRQGVRFKIFEFERDEATGNERLIGELNDPTAKITWNVTLGNGKAAGHFMMQGNGLQNEHVIIPDFNAERNPGINRGDLHPKATILITGKATGFSKLDSKIKGIPVALGAARTDINGNLVVLGGTGEAFAWNSPPNEITDFLNNDGWFDTTSDGPVDATVQVGNATPVSAAGAWVIVATPDFAPGILPIISLWDLMYDAMVRGGRIPKDPIVSYAKHIRPVLEKAAYYRFIHKSTRWSTILNEITVNDFSVPSPALQTKRKQLLTILNDSLSDLKLTPTQLSYFQDWVNGDYKASIQPTAIETTLPYLMDQASLTRAIGSGLYPGIEMGFMATNPALYSESFRFTRNAFTEFGTRQMTLTAGSVIQRMACPWQADFMECAGNWWPAQRPDLTKFKKDGSAADILWARGLVDASTASSASHSNMVKHFSDLAVIEKLIVAGQEIYVENGRNPALPLT